MNLFCVLSGSRVGESPAVRQRIEARYGQPARLIGDPNSSAVALALDDGGALMGVAESEGGFLIYSGLLTGRDGVAPAALMDDPHQSAASLLTAFLDDGIDALKGIDGQFVLAAYDAKRDRLLTLCDALGQRRLFSADPEGAPCFATHLAAMACVTAAPVDRSVEDFLLGFEFLPDGRTPLSGVTHLGPGEMRLRENATTTISRLTSADPSPTPLTQASDDEAAASRLLYDEFMAAVDAQCPSDDTLAVLLGGFDSALVAAALVRLGRRVETFTLRFDDERMNQRHVDTLQRELGCEHHWVKIDEGVLRDGLRSYGRVFNQPTSVAHYPIQIAAALQHMRERGHRHCFSGDGCDELFLGYPTIYKRARLFQRLGVLPAPLLRAGHGALGGRWLERRLGHPLRTARAALSVLARRHPARGHIAHRILDERSLGHLRLAPPPPQIFDVEDVLERLAAPHRDEDPIRLAYIAKRSVGLTRMRTEGATTVSGVTLRSPFQHPTLRRIAASLPLELLRPRQDTPASATGKYILARMAEEHGLLPREIIYQPKASPVTAPVDYWYMDALRDDLLAHFRALPFAVHEPFAADLLRPKLAEKLFREHYGLGHYCMHAASLLATYAAFNFDAADDVAGEDAAA